MTSQTFDSAEFWPAFLRDFMRAKGRVLIQSPFITIRRVGILSANIRTLIKRGVPICLFAQEPRGWESRDNLAQSKEALRLEELRDAITQLQSWGVHVNLKKNIHTKFAVIDEMILWEGSLNIMSFSSTKEHMRRWHSKIESQAAIKKYKLSDCSACKMNESNYIVRREGESLNRLGSILSARRTNLALTQRELALECNTTQRRIYDVEAGRNITVQSLLNITEKLEIETVLIPSLYVPAIARFLRERDNVDNHVGACTK